MYRKDIRTYREKRNQLVIKRAQKNGGALIPTKTPTDPCSKVTFP